MIQFGIERAFNDSRLGWWVEALSCRICHEYLLDVDSQVTNVRLWGIIASAARHATCLHRANQLFCYNTCRMYVWCVIVSDLSSNNTFASCEPPFMSSCETFAFSSWTSPCSTNKKTNILSYHQIYDDISKAVSQMSYLRFFWHILATLPPSTLAFHDSLEITQMFLVLIHHQIALMTFALLLLPACVFWWCVHTFNHKHTLLHLHMHGSSRLKCNFEIFLFQTLWPSAFMRVYSSNDCFVQSLTQTMHVNFGWKSGTQCGDSLFWDRYAIFVWWAIFNIHHCSCLCLKRSQFLLSCVFDRFFGFVVPTKKTQNTLLGLKAWRCEHRGRNGSQQTLWIANAISPMWHSK
jgi:hypothetical protein